MRPCTYGAAASAWFQWWRRFPPSPQQHQQQQQYQHKQHHQYQLHLHRHLHRHRLEPVGSQSQLCSRVQSRPVYSLTRCCWGTAHGAAPAAPPRSSPLSAQWVSAGARGRACGGVSAQWCGSASVHAVEQWHLSITISPGVSCVPNPQRAHAHAQGHSRSSGYGLGHAHAGLHHQPTTQHKNGEYTPSPST